MFACFRMTQPIPTIMYGTAWKEDATESLVAGALGLGFRAIDTANQRKHYHEAGVGQGIARVLATGVRRDELFLQTKFTFRAGQDHRLPYDPAAPVADQVAQSFRSSLEHLSVEYLDSLILHGPSQHDGLGHADREAWRAIEQIARSGGTRYIGISNISASQLRELAAFTAVPIAFVQNRCYASRRWDREIRTLCRDIGATYQGFSLLTANRDVVACREVRELANKYRRTPAQIVLRFAQQLGMIVLTGTTSPAHMRDDLTLEFSLLEHEVAALEAIS